MPIWLTVVASLAAAVIGGVISPQLAQTKERRSARAAVREKLGEVEALRWSGESASDFRRAMAALESAAIMARVSRRAIERYNAAAIAARKASDVLPVGPNGELEGAVDWVHEKAMVNALTDVTRHLWHPWATKLLPGRATGGPSADG